MLPYNKHLQFRQYKLDKTLIDTDSLNWGEWMFNCNKSRLSNEDEKIDSYSSRAANKRFESKMKKVMDRHYDAFKSLGLDD